MTRTAIALAYPTRGLPLGLAIAAACLAIASPADAQITTKMLIGSAISEPDASRYGDVADAIERYGNRDVIAAQQFLGTAKRKNPKLPPVAVMMAKLHLLSGNTKQVRPALDECINEAPDDPEPYLMLAEDAIRGGRTIEADALFDKAVLLMQSYDTNAKRKRDFIIRAYSGRTKIAQRRRKWDQAESDLKELIKVDPENAMAHYAMGQVMFLVDPPRAKEGIASFTEARKQNKDLEHPYVAAGKAFSGQDKTDQAMQYYAAAYKEAKDDQTVALAYSQALLLAGEISKAEPVLRTAVAKHPQSAGLYLLSGVAARMKGDTKAAEQHFVRALAILPTLGTAYEQLAQMLIESDDKEVKQRAVGFAVAAQKLSPKDPNANITLAWCFYQTDNPRQATTILQNIQSRTFDPDASYLLAEILMLNKQTKGAKSILTAALENKRNIFIKRSAAQKLLASLN